ncbi:hypothetical protein TREMEDRAFT_65467 [Tremella mesenterica DSM 1558]|uniref:uncharacterized protein n=1 Tax=Tremella mesenterica (strain ATCC 24925 / CBS 8224 / DSM 1558 / NBRC 9311 / NRRL Y-6157 / RJB 2259-6 / UBC 559-6) TaxID=578456 RepID=UPI00032C3714|nr:uncharacterized protein TREMEDRAFT_65467 [Tremella mesenterica DSM 1558]EIW66598.1 hypothetical protein TREMEDRAFT_65467 [Tremella mesenterica DSM 1558]
MSTRPQLDAYQSFMDRFTAALSQQGNTPRQVLSMGFGSPAITNGSPSVATPPAAGASAAVPSAPVSPATALTPLSLGQQEVRPAPVGPSQALGQSATVVEIDDDDEEMEVVDSDEEMSDDVDAEETGGASDEEEMDDVVDDGELGAGAENDGTGVVDVSGEVVFVDRAAWVAELKALSPIRITRGSPEAHITSQYSDGDKRVEYAHNLEGIKAEKRP